MDVGRLIMWILVGLGGLWVVGGAFIMSQDPSAWPPILIGFVLMGIGVGLRALVRKLDAAFDRPHVAPPGVREIAVQSRGGTSDGGRGTWARQNVIRVDEGASERDVARAREEWIRARLGRRSDWTSGRVVEDRARVGRWTPIALTGFALVLGGVAAASGEWFFGFAAAVVGVVAVGVTVHLIRAGMRQRRFGTAVLVLQRTPVALGARLSGVVLTGVPPQARARFRVVLECVRQWEETEGSGSDEHTHTHRETLWRGEMQSFGQARGDAPGTEVPVELDVPADQPGTTLDRDSEGISWELQVSAPLPGIDFAATFTLPVLPADEIPADAPAVA